MLVLLIVSLYYCIYGILSVVGLPSAVDTAVAGGPAVTGFPAVDGVLAVAIGPADPGVSAYPGAPI